MRQVGSPMRFACGPAKDRPPDYDGHRPLRYTVTDPAKTTNPISEHLGANARSRHAETVAKKRKTNKGKGRKAGGPKRKASRGLPDPSDHPDSTVRFIGGYEATKVYLCPGCQRDIPIGQPHLVAVPPEDADLRRHWHRGCWERRASSRF